MPLSRIATILANWNAYNDLIYKGKNDAIARSPQSGTPCRNTVACNVASA